MASLYSDEDIADDTVEFLRLHSHDVLTAKEADQAGKRIPDEYRALANRIHQAIVSNEPLQGKLIRVNKRS